MLPERSNTRDGSGAITAIARWSARHPWRALICWLAFVAACVAALTMTGSKSLNSGATGNSARAEHMLTLHQTRPAQTESGYLHSDSLKAGDPAFRAAIASVEQSMQRALGGQPSTRVGDDGHSVLVSGPNREGILHGRPRSRRRHGVEPQGHGRSRRQQPGRRQQRPLPRRAALDPDHAARAAVRLRRTRRLARTGAACRHRRSRGVRAAWGRSARSSRSTPASRRSCC